MFDVWEEMCVLNVCDILLSSASARRTCRSGSRSRSAASWTGGAPRGSRPRPPGREPKEGGGKGG